MEISVETPQDAAEVEALFDLSFAPGRGALSSYRLREGVAPVAALCRVARADGAVAGAIRFWPVRVGTEANGAPALLLGPVAVHPTRQGEGLGAVLIEEGLAAAAAEGWSRAMLVGDAPYYGRFGFARLAGVLMPPPTNPERVLGRALVLGAWDGVAGPVTRWTDAPGRHGPIERTRAGRRDGGSPPIGCVVRGRSATGPRSATGAALGRAGRARSWAPRSAAGASPRIPDARSRVGSRERRGMP